MRAYAKILISFVVIGLAASAGAEEHGKRAISVKVLGDYEANSTSFFFDSDDIDLDLDAMQVGETHSVIDESGRSILITRTETGHSFNIDGEVVEMPLLIDADHSGIHWSAAGGDGEVHVISDFESATFAEAQGTMIVSPTPIDAATQQAIKSLLESAGYGSEVEFIDHESAGPASVKVRKIEKVVTAP